MPRAKKSKLAETSDAEHDIPQKSTNEEAVEGSCKQGKQLCQLCLRSPTDLKGQHVHDRALEPNRVGVCCLQQRWCLLLATTPHLHLLVAREGPLRLW